MADLVLDPTTAAPAVIDRSVITIPLDAGLTCLRCLSPKRLRFEVEYGLERGTSANSFLFLPSSEMTVTATTTICRLLRF